MTCVPRGMSIGPGRAALAREDQVDGGRGGRLEADADEPQELDVQLVRHPVEPVQERLGEEGEDLEQDDARVTRRQVRPLGRLLP